MFMAVRALKVADAAHAANAANAALGLEVDAATRDAAPGDAPPPVSS